MVFLTYPVVPRPQPWLFQPSVCIYPPEGGEEIARAGDVSVVLTTTGCNSEPHS